MTSDDPGLPADFDIQFPFVFVERGVTATIVPSRRRIEPAVEAAIDRAWSETNARPGVTLFDGAVCRLEDVRCYGRGNYPVADESPTNFLDLFVSRTSYRVNVGTNFVNPHLADTFGADVMANPLGVSAGLISADGFLIFGRRNGSVAYYPHMLHPFAGSLEVRDEINLFDDCRRELREEIGLLPGEIARIELIGIAEDRRLRHPELIFRVRSTLTRDEIQAKVDPAEHVASEAWRCDVETLTKMLRRADVTPVGRAIAKRLIELL